MKDSDPDDGIPEASWDRYLGGKVGAEDTVDAGAGAGTLGLGGKTGSGSDSTDTTKVVKAGPGIGRADIGVSNGAVGRSSVRGNTGGSGSFGLFVRAKNARTHVTAPYNFSAHATRTQACTKQTTPSTEQATD